MIGLGAVALADALALGRHHEVVLTGPVPDLVDDINAGRYRLTDPCLAGYLAAHQISVRATLDTRAALENAQMVFVSAPLSLDPETNFLRTVELESRIELAAQLLPHVPIAIRSAVPIGFTQSQRTRLNGAKLVYAPEFSRIGNALWDILNPSFLIVGDRGNLGQSVARVLASAALVTDIPVRQMDPSETEALRHLSVLYEDAQVAYFKQDHGVPRIEQTPISAADLPRQECITVLADRIRGGGLNKVGFYLPSMSSSDTPGMIHLQTALRAVGVCTQVHIGGADGLDHFKNTCDVVVAQSVSSDLTDIRAKVVTRDHYAAI
jgi:UDPglucose 6-dehydrogenase